MTNRLELNWKVDGFVDEQRYYCSETSIDPLSPPLPKATLASDVRSYIDADVVIDKMYYVAVGSVKNGIEKLSGVFQVYTDDRVVSILHFEGPNNSTVITDEKGKVWTPVNAVLKTDYAAVGLSSLYLAGNGYIYTPYNNEFELESVDFSLECYISPTNNTQGVIITNRDKGTVGWMLRRESNGAVGFYYIGTGAPSVVSPSGTTPANTFTKIEVKRIGTTLQLLINDSLVATSTTNQYIKVSTKRISVGAAIDADGIYSYFSGYIDELKIEKSMF
ncbi:LamG-like jellyroll fold domain-containing protein [Acinetobacter celticus]|uniref:Uncharacterized protein n=1 Tax=Acinetobacter celticus TaxID=1891224 RepID=A0A1C3CV35_9GAMM|nr:LamG-like jellyroll fold domain-containing protein [Acinetobacter celticus]ODA12593.1 hypothetical protein BBP83_08470 [Acinetobacter celticus]